ncbi:OmpA family protein [Hymenobacter sp. J193]|uniref:OmpA family protein n=1 Tax=Hymenobacter sp. J193 TaxID=2898429 RepID=UPI00215196FA|nr:OmpA family protein [Hymenobacter sp. J193]MCR5889242.1 OmpA family protein [Hymenobacter sp. J193]
MKTPFLSLLTLSALTLASCDSLNKPAAKDEPQEATADTAVVYRDGKTAGDVADDAANGAENAFDIASAKLTDTTFPEIKTKGVTVRGNEDYQVYSVDETVLFDTDKATIKPSAAATLQEVVGSIGQRHADKDVRVMGFADSRGDASYNKDLAQQRANAVKSYLVDTGKMPAAKISTESFGEQQPAATNATAAGRKENRRVELVVRVR